jgi:outer membrane receptor protein involved in Fe transport
MKKKLLPVFLFVITYSIAFGQFPTGQGGGNRSRSGQNMNIGHFYGKIVDSKTNKGLGGVTVQLTGNKFDTVSKKMKEIILKTVISASHGDFSLEGLPVMGNFKLKISAMGYAVVEKNVSFDIKIPQGGVNAAPVSGSQDNEGMGRMQQILSQADKDLGNIKIEVSETDLGNVTVTAPTKPLFELGIDKKVFNVDKNLVSTGQTATEIMKSIPSLDVDIDGNVTLRNATPTLFVDGRPTTLTLDQIPSDIIDKVEIITNPSAKYDASGGNAGILNLVLKKNRKNGYNGGIRAGIDARGKVNLGGDINYRQNKINFFGSINYNERKSESTTLTNTEYFGATSSDNTNVYSNTKGTNNGNFKFGRAGLDYFVDNRNTISVTGNYAKGSFNNVSSQLIDTTQYGSLWNTDRGTSATTAFENFGSQLSFKHNFAKNGHDITADANYNSSTSSSNSLINSYTYQPTPYENTLKYPLYQQQSIGSGYNHFLTIQTDYENPISDDTKFEAGARAAIRDFRTDNLQYINDNISVHTLTLSPMSSSRYKFTDQVYAAYSTYSFKYKRFSYQLGLRAESSSYNGKLFTLSGADSTPFKVSYPLSLFPSAFITYKIDDKQDFQLNYSRRINRPNFFQLLPSYDFSDPQNPSVGNPGLKPEFTNSFEMSYNDNYARNSNFLATVYFKYTTDLITRYAYKDINKDVQPGVITTDSLYYTSYINANNSYTYGLELTDKMEVVKWWDLTLNINFYDSKINATIPNQTVDNSLLSWFGKINSTFKVAKGISFQLSGDSHSKTLIPQSGSGQGGGGRGGGAFGGGQQALAQGYTLPRYYNVDAAIRKDWTWKNGQSGSLTLSINDIFRDHTKTHTELPLNFVQDVDRTRDPQVFRLNFNYRFGKFDAALFKRKNTKADQGAGMDMMGGDNNNK